MRDLFQVERRNTFSLISLQLLLLSFFLTSVNGQDDKDYQHSTFLIGIHSSGRINENIDLTTNNTFGFSLEYRQLIAEINPSFYFSLGGIINSYGYKKEYTSSEYFQSIQCNLAFPLHLFYSISSSFYAGIGVSFDLPFAERNERLFQQMQSSYTELTVRLLNINVGAGVVVGSRFRITDDMDLLFEGKARFTGIKGAKSNDYWPYSEGVTPYLIGVNLGIGW